MKKYIEFLKQVEGFNAIYASIYFNCELESLTMPFWSWEDIQNGLDQREEWEVDKALIPFYGDWHDLFCINADTGEIVALNDERKILCIWDSVEVFLKSLSEQEIVYDDGSMETNTRFYDNSQEQGLKH